MSALTFARENFGVQFSEGAFSSPCPCCGGSHANFDSTDFGPLAFLNADDRGGTVTNGKPSLTVTDAGATITRTNQFWGTGLGTAANVSFAFRSTAPATMPSDTIGFTRFTDVQIAAVLSSLQAWSDVANITFNRVQDADGYSDNATMLFGDYAGGQSGSAAFAYLPGNRTTTSASGDVWVNYSGSNVTPNLLNYGQHTLTHEIGHAIGLSHPATYNASEGVSITYGNDATFYEDSRQYTVMSYFSETNTGASYRNAGGIAQYSAVPLLDDIAAAQRLYGANTTTRTSDTVYGFNSNADRPWFTATSATTSLIFAIWDAGGTDTLDFSGFSQAQIIDLRQGAFSNVGGLIGNVAIAAGAVIENAVGGSGADTIRGNSANNRITGGAGNDTVDGGLGTDTVVFSGVRSGYNVIWNGQTGTVAGNGQTVTVTNVEFLAFSDQTIAAAPTGALNVSGDLTNDTMNGTTLNDILSGGGGADLLNGLGGNDQLFGGIGDDALNGGDGDDTLIGGLGDDTLDGGAGFDLADYVQSTAGISVDLAAGVATGAGIGNDTLTGVENVRGTSFADTLRGNGANNILRGNGGADVMYGGAGGDSFYSGPSGVGGGAPDLVKNQATGNSTQATAVSLDAGFDIAPRTDVASSSTTPHATVAATGSGQVEWYSFTAISGSAVTIDIDNAAFDSVVRIFNSSGSLLATNDDGSTSGDAGNDTDSALTFTIPADGIYYVQVSEWVSGSDTNLTTTGVTAGAAYTLHVSAPGHPVVATNSLGSSMFGEAGDDFFYQGVNIDTINIGSGNDAIDGGTGTDTVVFGAASTAYMISASNGVTTVTGGMSGTDTITNVEFLQFSDRTISLAGAGGVINGTANGDTLIGSPGDDIISGLGGDDFVNGRGGADILTGGAGSDQLDGGDGNDTAAYAGVRRQYGTANSSTVVGGPEGGADSLISIENARFVDGTLTFDVDSASAQVMRLYGAALGRQYDPAGLEGQSAWIRNGTISLQTLADAFVSSAEFQNRFGALGNQAFIEQLYQFSLHRAGEPAGVSGWTGLLDNGTMTRGQIVIGFSESAEHRGLTQNELNKGLWVADAHALIIARLYDATFDRLPEAEGLIGWTASLKAGIPLSQIAAGFADSPEFQARYGALSNRAFIEQLFNFCLNRNGDEAGIQNWVNNMDAGLRTRAQVLLEFSESQEHVNLTNSNMLGGVQTFDYHSAPVVADDTSIKGLSVPLTLPFNEDGVATVAAVEIAKVLPAMTTDDHLVKTMALTSPVVSAYMSSADMALTLPVLADLAVTEDAFILPLGPAPAPLVLPAEDLAKDLVSTDAPTGMSSFALPHDIALTDAPDWTNDHPAWARLTETDHWIWH